MTVKLMLDSLNGYVLPFLQVGGGHLFFALHELGLITPGESHFVIAFLYDDLN